MFLENKQIGLFLLYFFIVQFINDLWWLSLSLFLFSDLYFKLDHIPWSAPISLVSIFLDLNLQSERLIVMIEYMSARCNQWACPFSR